MVERYVVPDTLWILKCVWHGLVANKKYKIFIFRSSFETTQFLTSVCTFYDVCRARYTTGIQCNNLTYTDMHGSSRSSAFSASLPYMYNLQIPQTSTNHLISRKVLSSGSCNAFRQTDTQQYKLHQQHNQ